MGRWLKDQKERKKQEIRTQNAHVHAAVSVAGVAAAVAALAASNAMSAEVAATQQKTPSKLSSAVASAAALVASHCIEIAEDMGADHDQILTVVNSAINARTNGDIMTLTAGAATGDRILFQLPLNYIKPLWFQILSSLLLRPDKFTSASKDDTQ
jgi:hypothetical protein